MVGGGPSFGWTLFEACSISIATRATDLIGIYESDNGRKEE